MPILTAGVNRPFCGSLPTLQEDPSGRMVECGHMGFGIDRKKFPEHNI